jgi:prepilin-type N-terminal cleavage/methylation domain-containing protein
MNTNFKRQCGRGGFTLVELLVVMVIIGILVAMVTPVIFQALRSAKEAEISSEVNKLAQAVEVSKNQYQDYFPDGSQGGGGGGSGGDLQRFTRKAFPEMQTQRGSRPPSDLNPARAIVFWLSEVSTDPMNPFRPPMANQSGGKGVKMVHDFFSFNTGRLRTGLYYPPGTDPNTSGAAPYVYFCNRTYANASYDAGGRRLKPYHYGKKRTGQSGGSGGNQNDFAAPDSFQIIAAGMDKNMGTGGQLYSEEGQGAGGGGDFITYDDEDNIVSFDTRRVGDIRR